MFVYEHGQTVRSYSLIMYHKKLAFSLVTQQGIGIDAREHVVVAKLLVIARQVPNAPQFVGVFIICAKSSTPHYMRYMFNSHCLLEMCCSLFIVHVSNEGSGHPTSPDLNSYFLVSY